MTPVAYWAAVQQRYPAFNVQLLADLVQGLSLAQHQDKALYMLSTGSKRKVWLAAAFASGAVVTLLDEPFAALDKASINLVLELLHDAATNATRAWVVADYEAPRGVPLAATIAL
jgi:ABC-type Mn2+/Zn2+ transport system ATPase subunit